MKQINFTIDESNNSNDEKNKMVGIALVVHDNNISKEIKRVIDRFCVKNPDNISSELNYHFKEDSKSLRIQVLEKISELNITSYSVIIYLSKKIDTNKIYEIYFNDLLKPILMKYEKMGYGLFNINFENLSSKLQKDKKFLLRILSEDIFFKKRIERREIIIKVVKKNELVTILPDYIIGSVLFFLKSEDKKPNSLGGTYMNCIKNRISQIKVISDKNKWYDFKKQEGYNDFMKL